MHMIKWTLIACLFDVFMTLTQGDVHSTRFKGIEFMERQWIERLRKIFDSVNVKNVPRSVTEPDSQKIERRATSDNTVAKFVNKNLARAEKTSKLRNESSRNHNFQSDELANRESVEQQESLGLSISVEERLASESKEQNMSRSEELDKNIQESKENKQESKENKQESKENKQESKEKIRESKEKIRESKESIQKSKENIRESKENIRESKENTRESKESTQEFKEKQGNSRTRDSSLQKSEEIEAVDDFKQDDEEVEGEDLEEKEEKNSKSTEANLLNLEDESEENDSDSSEEEFGYKSGKLEIYSGEISYEDLKDSSIESFLLENRIRGIPVYKRTGTVRRLKGIVLLGNNKGGQARYISVEEDSSEETSDESSEYLFPQGTNFPYYNHEYYRRFPHASMRLDPQGI